MEIQGARQAKTILQKQKQDWRTLTSQYQNLLQGYNNQENMVLVRENRQINVTEQRSQK